MPAKGCTKINRTRKGWKTNCTMVRYGSRVCWEWKFGCADNGRPIINHDDGRLPEHAARFAYRLFYGELKYHALHKCDNVKCVRPSHIEDGTREKNMRDMWARHPRSEYIRNKQSKLITRLNNDKEFAAKRSKAASRRMRKLWKSPAWRIKMRKVLDKRNHPNGI